MYLKGRAAHSLAEPPGRICCGALNEGTHARLRRPLYAGEARLPAAAKLLYPPDSKGLRHVGAPRVAARKKTVVAIR